MKIARFNGKTGKVVQESVGRVLVQFDDGQHWILKGIPNLEIEEQFTGRPRKFSTNAEKQRAYRERKKGKPLRKWGQG